MRDSIELEMVSRSIETGPNPETFYDPRRRARRTRRSICRATPDGVVYDGDELVSPIDEFNAPVGAGLCQADRHQVLQQAQGGHRHADRGGAEEQQRDGGDRAGADQGDGVADAVVGEDRAAGELEHRQVRQGERGQQDRLDGQAFGGLDGRLLLHQPVGAEGEREGEREPGQPAVVEVNSMTAAAAIERAAHCRGRKRSPSTTTPSTMVTSGLMK